VQRLVEKGKGVDAGEILGSAGGIVSLIWGMELMRGCTGWGDIWKSHACAR